MLESQLKQNPGVLVQKVRPGDPATVLGQSEVQLGLLPAGGGTQRLVERVGLTGALPLLLTGRRVRARKALRLGPGFVDISVKLAIAYREIGQLQKSAGELKRIIRRRRDYVPARIQLFFT